MTCEELAVTAIATSERIAELESMQPTASEKAATYLAAMKSGGLLTDLGEGSGAVRRLETKTEEPITQMRGELRALHAVATGKGCVSPR